MVTDNMKRTITDILSAADVQVNGSRPWDIRIHDDIVYSRFLSSGSLGLGECYMEGMWDCASLDQFFAKVLEAGIESRFRSRKLILHALKGNILNRQKRAKAFDIGKKHYDMGNRLYQLMLGKTMAYSCAYWENAKSLDDAQEKKLDLICRKLELKAGMDVLEIGCGWGSFAKFAAEKYGVNVVGITVSAEQVKLSQDICAGLPVEIRLQDYRDLDEQFDRVVSIGMFEHVGPKNYREYMGVAHRCLNKGGLFLLHTIGRNTSSNAIDPWMDRYIFPGAVLPSAKQISAAAEGLFVMEDWHSFGPHYDRTLMAWHDNFCRNWAEISREGGYDERFFRMWNYYLQSCAGTFRARKNQLWQIVFSNGGVPGGYDSIR